MGLLPYDCTASDVEVVLSTCTLPSSIRMQFIGVQTTSAVDAFSDLLSMEPPALHLIRFQNCVLT